jgi:undecaprenyl diphosphate synthase
MPAKAAAALKSPPLDATRIPKHVAIIMDGNGRWAKSKGYPRLAGHRAGVESVRQAVRTCSELGVSYLTLYSFSTENWLRPKDEVNELMKLLSYALKKETLELGKNNVRLRAVGRLDGLPSSVREELERACKKLEKNTGLTLNLALNYGSRQEIVDAVNALIAQGAKYVTEKDISTALYTGDMPDPDLVIRTSGEMRVSNFLLWQIAYSELYVTPTYWPDFRDENLREAVREFQRRERRFGGL